MKLFSPASRGLLRDKSRVTLPSHLQLSFMALISGLCALCLMYIVAFGAGYYLAQLGIEQTPIVVSHRSTVPEPSSAEPFQSSVPTLRPSMDEHKVAVDVRIEALESDVLVLERLFDEHARLRNQMSSVDIKLLPSLFNTTSASAGRGGRLLSPQACSSGYDASTANVSAQQRSKASVFCLESALSGLLERLHQRNRELMAVPTRLPVEGGRLVSSFGNRVDPINRRRAFHSGIDFSLPAGSPVRSSAAGTITVAAYDSEYGKRVEIDHGNGLTTLYAHLSSITVRVGEIVKPAQLIGEVGSTGRSTGAHLHFEVLKDGKYIDPRRVLSFVRNSNSRK